MRSPAARHFPTVVFRNNERCLWNSLQRKPLVNRPEERVRLRYLDYLLLEAGWPRSRVAIETQIRPTDNSRQMRADLICYSAKLDPVILIECKSGYIKPGESAAFQITRYNKAVGAEFLCITNGIEDHWFRVNTKRAGVLKKLPFPISGTGFTDNETSVDGTPTSVFSSFDVPLIKHNVPESTHSGNLSNGDLKGFTAARSLPEYWQQRGFLGAGSRQTLLEVMTEFLLTFWESDSEEKATYLSFQATYRNVPFDHYYRLFDLDEAHRMAVTFTGSASGETWLIAFLNEKQVAKGYVAINMDKLYSGDTQSAELVVMGESVIVDTGAYFQFDSFRTGKKSIESIVLKLYDIFKMETEK